MRILVAHNSHKIAGGEQRVFELESALLERAGHTVIRFNPHNEVVDGMSHLRLAAKTVWNQSSGDKIARLIAEHRPDIIHAHNIVPLISPSVFKVAKKNNVPVVWTLHNYRMICPGMHLLRDGKPCELCVSRRFATPAIQHKCYRGSRSATATVATMQVIHNSASTWDYVDRFITPSDFTREKLIQGGLPKDKLVTKANFVPGSPEIGSGDGNRFLFVGRLSEEKGVQCLLDAWRSHSIPHQLRIVGDGPMVDQVRQAAIENPCIEYVGRQTADQVRQLMGSSIATIVPSICYETFGIAAIESFSVGTPAITSDTGALAELIQVGRNGLTFPTGDHDALAEAVGEIVDRDLKQMRREARLSYEQKYTDQQNLTDLMRIYEDVLGIARPSPRKPFHLDRQEVDAAKALNVS